MLPAQNGNGSNGNGGPLPDGQNHYRRSDEGEDAQPLAPVTHHPGGRPRFIDSPEGFDALVDSYAAKCKDEGSRPTFAGLAWHMGFASRQSLYDYGRRFPEFAYSVARAKLLVESGYEAQLFAKNVSHQGPIFALKNHGWMDKQVQERTGPGGGPEEHNHRHLVGVVDPRERLARRIAGIAARRGAAGVPGESDGGGSPPASP